MRYWACRPQLKRDALGACSVLDFKTSYQMPLGAAAVGIVVNPTSGETLTKLAASMPIWLADTSGNRPLAEAYWRAHPSPPLPQVTTFQVEEGRSPEEWCLSILDVVLEHHGPYSQDPPVSRLIFFGAALSADLAAELAERGFSLVRETPEGFEASSA